MVKKIVMPTGSIKVRSCHDKYLQNDLTGYRLFCEDSHIDIVKQQYIVNILRSCESYGIKDYFGEGKHLLMNNETYLRKNVVHIPFHHKEGSFTKKVYKQYGDSNLILVCENITLDDNVIKECYIVVPNDFDTNNPQHKQALCSFVSIFN